MVKRVNISPNPRILEAITHNPLKPINALCELIDNAMDGFAKAEKNNIKIRNKIIEIKLPTRSEIKEGSGKLVITDYGPGMSSEELKLAVTAGYTGNKNPLDTLGLFGMGFNISTGKLGRVTVISTCRKEDKFTSKIKINIPEMIDKNSFFVPVEQEKKYQEGESGTTIEISEWWPRGSMNEGFIDKLLSIGKPQLRESIGRVYSTKLKEDIRILIDGEDCPKFNHCVWSEKRSVRHHKWGDIPAKINVNESLGSEIRCDNCWNLLENSTSPCPVCKKKKTARTIDKKIYGWVGIQRYDSTNHFGIDLIRNGRAIRILEQAAFFKWADASGNTVNDYPIDNPYGRIIGEINMDFVPVDYLKTDFQRTSPEWGLAMKALRGESSLQPRYAQEHNEPENNSPIFKLYQGYRSVRDYGTKDLYMGYWDPVAKKPQRISRDIEAEYLDKFNKGVPGYGINDDEEWYKLVLQADQIPLEDIRDCPQCQVQNPLTSEICKNCGYIFDSKECVSCNAKIPKSEIICPECGVRQEISEEGPWVCSICGWSNPPDEDECRRCENPRGSVNVFDLEKLLANANLIDGLSIENLTIPLPEDRSMTSIKLKTYYLKDPYRMERGKMRVPVYIHRTSSEFIVFIDPNHETFVTFQDRPEDYISMELARSIREEYSSSINDNNRAMWSLSNLYYLIQKNVWEDRVALSPQETLAQVNNYLSELYDKLPILLRDKAEEIFENCDEREQSVIQQEMIKNNIPTSKLEEKINNGEFLRFVPESMLIKLIEKYPEKFFDGNYWEDAYEKLSMPDLKILEETKSSIVRKYIICLNDLLSFKDFKNPDSDYTQKVNQTLKIIKAYLINKSDI